MSSFDVSHSPPTDPPPLPWMRQGESCLLEEYTFSSLKGLPPRQLRSNTCRVVRGGELAGIGLYVTLHGQQVGASKTPSTSSNHCHARASSNWRNIVIVLRRCVRVEPGDLVLLRSDVQTGDKKRPTYQLCVSLIEKGSARERLLDAVQFGVPELYPTEAATKRFTEIETFA